MMENGQFRSKGVKCMEFKIRMKGIGSGIRLKIKFNNQVVSLNESVESHVFYFDSPGEYTLNIIQEKSKPITIKKKIFYYLLSLIQAIFYILLYHHNDSWRNDISPYCIERDVKISLFSSTEIVCCFIRGKLYKKPSLCFANNSIIVDSKTIFTKNVYDFKLKLFHFYRKVNAVFCYVYAVFIIAIQQAFVKKDIEFFFLWLLLLIFFCYLHIKFFIKNKKDNEELKLTIYDD